MIRIASVAMLVAMVAIRTAALLALMKFLAVQFGAEGFGQLSQVLAVGALFSVLAGGGLTNGIVRNLAASDDARERLAWMKAAVPIAAIAAVVLGVSAVWLHHAAEAVLFPGQDLGFVLLVMALSQAVVGFGNIANAYLSGTHDVRAFATANALGSVAAAALIAALAAGAGFRGAAAGCAAMALTPALVTLFTTGRRLDWRGLRTSAFDWGRSLVLLRFGGSMYIAAAAVPLAWVYVRSDLAVREGWEAVGLWQSVTRISDAYMQVFGVIFMNYALPQLASTQPSARSRRLRHIAMLIFGLFVPGACVLYVFRYTVLTLGFSSAFTDAAIYLAPQILGDCFKLVSLVFVYYLMALNRASVLAWMEMLQAGVVLAGYWGLVQTLGDRAPVMSYVLATSAVMVVTLLIFLFGGGNGAILRRSASPSPAIQVVEG
jgi:O-antigen/teichoic acid export membrane protein